MTGVLPGFIAEVLAVTFTISRHVSDGCYGFFVDLVIGIFGNESAVRLHGWDSALFGEVGSRLDVGNARVSRFAGHQTDGQWPLIEVPHFPAGPANNNGGGLDLVFVERLAQAARKLPLGFVHVDLAGRQAEVMDLGNCALRIPADTEDQPKP